MEQPADINQLREPFLRNELEIRLIVADNSRNLHSNPMKKILTTLSILSFSLITAIADTLQSLNVKDWTSYHAVSRGKYHAIGVSQDGRIDLYFMKRGAKINVRTPVEIKLIVERKLKKEGSKWTKKTIKKDGFITPPKPSEDPAKLSLHGIVTGDVEFKIDFAFSKEGVLMKAAFVGKPKDAETADYRLSLESEIDEMYSVSTKDRNDEKKIKSKTRGSELRITTRKGKGKATRFRFHEPIEVEKLEKEEIIALELKCEKNGRKDLFWSLADPKLGSFKIIPSADNKMPYDGFKLTTVLVDETGKKQGEGILLEYK